MYITIAYSSNLNTNVEQIISLAKSQSLYQQGKIIIYLHFTINYLKHKVISKRGLEEYFMPKFYPRIVRSKSVGN